MHCSSKESTIVFAAGDYVTVSGTSRAALARVDDPVLPARHDLVGFLGSSRHWTPQSHGEEARALGALVLVSPGRFQGLVCMSPSRCCENRRMSPILQAL